VYEGPVYPGTLTCHRPVTNIELVSGTSGQRIGMDHYRYMVLMSFCKTKPQVPQMLMRSLTKNAGYGKHRQSGFSLLEMMVVVAIGFIATAITFISMVPVMQQQRVSNAYNTTLSAMRQARDNAVSQRTSYSVTFASTSSPVSNTITVAPTLSTFTGAQTSVTYRLPSDVLFLAQSGLPAAAPDGYGTGLAAIDFGYTVHATGGSHTVYFCPDGSAQDDTTGNCLGNADGGVVYLARSGDMLSSRAVSLWGTTGRIRGWRLYSNGSGGYQWLRQ
jgi:prepilin-type N-terminal cleavage/methylation domain-containing protein